MGIKVRYELLEAARTWPLGEKRELPWGAAGRGGGITSSGGSILAVAGYLTKGTVNRDTKTTEYFRTGKNVPRTVERRTGAWPAAIYRHQEHLNRGALSAHATWVQRFGGGGEPTTAGPFQGWRSLDHGGWDVGTLRERLEEQRAKAQATNELPLMRRNGLNSLEALQAAEAFLEVRFERTRWVWENTLASRERFFELTRPLYTLLQRGQVRIDARHEGPARWYLSEVLRDASSAFTVTGLQIRSLLAGYYLDTSDDDLHWIPAKPEAAAAAVQAEQLRMKGHFDHD